MDLIFTFWRKEKYVALHCFFFHSSGIVCYSCLVTIYFCWICTECQFVKPSKDKIFLSEFLFKVDSSNSLKAYFAFVLSFSVNIFISAKLFFSLNLNYLSISFSLRVPSAFVLFFSFFKFMMQTALNLVNQLLTCYSKCDWGVKTVFY